MNRSGTNTTPLGTRKFPVPPQQSALPKTDPTIATNSSDGAIPGIKRRRSLVDLDRREVRESAEIGSEMDAQVLKIYARLVFLEAHVASLVSRVEELREKNEDSKNYKNNSEKTTSAYESIASSNSSNNHSSLSRKQSSPLPPPLPPPPQQRQRPHKMLSDGDDIKDPVKKKLQPQSPAKEIMSRLIKNSLVTQSLRVITSPIHTPDVKHAEKSKNLICGYYNLVNN
ncbi:hypothetical protein HK100_011065 [Physocladia obscura]|uniref:Uncharacterized protein n=1 Tax=Physocladia obscura TaxID=109957 RepID=A0AAD5XDI9_9FUNG|nr:hypothetical protein HK100_011065 [Physocladia obscura]